MFPTPKSLGSFSLLRILGRGGMGVVYLARDDRLGREVALKVLDIYDAPDQEQKSRFLREARAAAAIRHPNVATIYEVGETAEGLPYLVMEYCQGLTLAQLIRRGPVDTARWLSIARQIADGVAAAHRNGIVHRDIKSANIVLQDDEVVKILDFGLAKKFDESVSRSATARFSSGGSTFFGTLPYISPEQAHGRPADHRSDLFSVGVVLYELATAKLPFDDDSPIMLLEKIRDEEPAPFEPADPLFPAAASAIMSRLLQKEPNDRMERAEELADALRAIAPEVATRPQTTRKSKSTTKLSATVRQKRPASAFALIVASVVLVIVAAVVILFSRPGGAGATAARAPAASAATPIRSLAVMPFRNISQSSSDAFLSLGFADALVTKLQQIPELNVRPTSAILPFQKEAIDTKTAGAHLQVDGVLEGHFLSSGDQVRVNLQLTDTRTGYGVWAATVDGRRDNLILLMDQVSLRTASALNQRLATKTPTGRSLPATSNPQAYEEYLQARALIGSHLPAESAQQIAHLRKAIELDPQFAAAYAELAIAISLRQVRGFSSDASLYDQAEWFARQAVRLDPNLAEAHLALGRALVRKPERFRESVRENLAALRINPADPQALYTLATYFNSTGEPQRADCVGDLMEKIDPSSNDVRTRGYWSVNAVDPEGALELSRRALAHRETALAGHDMRAQAFLVLGNLTAAEQERKSAEAVLPNHYIPKSIAAQLAAARGDRAAAVAHIASMRKDAETNHWAAIRVALSYAKLGDVKTAVEWVKRANVLGNHNWYFLVRHPWFQPLQQSPDFQRTVTRIRRDLDDVRDDVVGVFDLICGQKGVAT